MSSERRRVAVVTGASSGIGKATAELLCERGVSVIGIARRFADTETTRHADVGDEPSVAEAFRGIVERFGRLDILVNCAGVVTKNGPLEVSVNEWEAVLRTNVIGTYLCCRQALLTMRAQRYGRIVNISSVAGRAYSATASLAYTSSKYAVIGLTRQLAANFGKEGITVNCVCPSETRTEMLLRNVSATRLSTMEAAHPLGRLAEPREIAQAVSFLAQEEASYLNGAVIDVNGGLL